MKMPEIKPVSDSGEIVLSKVVIPEFVVVHDGPPSDPNAANYYVRYRDYIKNVASSEIYLSLIHICDGNGQKQGAASCMADTGENTFPCEYFRRQCRNVGRHVSVLTDFPVTSIYSIT